MSSDKLDSIVRKLEKKQEILEQKIAIIKNSFQNIEEQFREIDQEIHSVSIDEIGLNKPELSESIDEFTESNDDESTKSNDDESTKSNDDESIESNDDESTESNKESPFIAKYSNPIKYPNMDLATNINDYIETIDSNDSKITLYFCCFSINTDSLKPFVLYSVKSVKSANNIVQFPSMDVDKTKDIDILSNNIIKEGTYIGYLPHKKRPTNIYMFYSVETPDLLPGKCATINELCHLKSVDGIKTDPMLNDMFSQNESLIYIHDEKTGENLKVPFSGYLCNVDENGKVVNVNYDADVDDAPLMDTDIFKIGLEGEYYYLTSRPINQTTDRFAIFPMNAITFDSASSTSSSMIGASSSMIGASSSMIIDYSEYNSVFHSMDTYDIWAVSSIKQISKI